MKIIVLLSLFFIGACAGRAPETVVYRDVYVPQFCEVNMPDRPEYQGTAVIDVLAVVEYAKKLETTLKRCIK